MWLNDLNSAQTFYLINRGRGCHRPLSFEEIVILMTKRVHGLYQRTPKESYLHNQREGHYCLIIMIRGHWKIYRTREHVRQKATKRWRHSVPPRLWRFMRWNFPTDLLPSFRCTRWMRARLGLSLNMREEKENCRARQAYKRILRHKPLSPCWDSPPGRSCRRRRLRPAGRRSRSWGWSLSSGPPWSSRARVGLPGRRTWWCRWPAGCRPTSWICSASLCR